MTDVEKFTSDVAKLKKMDRHEHNNETDYNRLSTPLADLFAKSSQVERSLAGTIFDYWEKNYIWNQADLSEAPADAEIAKLGAFLAFLNNSDENAELVTKEDWKSLAELVNFEAEDMDIGKLTELMAILVDHHAL
ncbi:MAG: hypothetical protein MJ181_00780 [Treponema sp.]|nr:hypothetical protein [Treponema sp.]